MTTDQRGKRRLIAIGNEPLHELAIRLSPGTLGQHDLADLPQQRWAVDLGHGSLVFTALHH